jgi:molecular chaperone HscB
MGLEPAPAIDASALEKRFHELSRQLHPDRFAKASARERRVALERTTALNEAYRTLRDPAARAAYFLGLHGVRVDEKASTAMSPEFLDEMLEYREALSHARRNGDLATARALREEFRQRASKLQGEIDGALVAWSATKDRARIEDAASKLAAMRYVRRFLDEVEALEADAAS